MSIAHENGKRTIALSGLLWDAKCGSWKVRS